MKHLFDATSQKQCPTLGAKLELLYQVELAPLLHVFNSEYLKMHLNQIKNMIKTNLKYNANLISN